MLKICSKFALWISFAGCVLCIGRGVCDDNTVVVSDEAALCALTETSCLVVLGTVDAISYNCDDGPRTSADISVHVDEAWKGVAGSSVVLSVPGVKVPNRDCGKYFDDTRPEIINVGEQYLFICWSKWDAKRREWLDGYIVPFGGLLGYRDTTDELFFYGTGRAMSMSNSGYAMRACLALTRPASMEANADLVVVLDSIRIPEISGTFRGELANRPIMAHVRAVLKGKYSESEITIDPNLVYSSLWCPRINSDDVAVVFLVQDDGGRYGLLGGPEGYMILQEDELLHNSRKSSGGSLRGGKIVDREAH